MRSVGIIGGFGPETTSEFYLDLVFSCQKIVKESRPGIIISSVPLPYEIEKDFIEKNIGSERYIPFLVKEAIKLEKSGVDFIVMPCNSLHIFIKEIRAAVSIPVLSIIEETIQFLHKNNLKKVGIVSTLATMENKLYESAFEKEEIDYETPDDFQQVKMGKFILNLVNGRQNNRDRDELIQIINDFSNKNVDCVLLACTDLQLLMPRHPTLKVFDTMKIFVDATVKELLK